MKVTQTVKKVVKPLVDVPTWMGYTQLKQTTNDLVSTIKSLFAVQRSEVTETFEESLKRLGIKETDLQQRVKEFRNLCIFYLILALLVFSYVIYLIGWARSIHGAVAGFAITLIILTQAFRYHFWMFQIRARKLGCTFREWFDSGFMGEKRI